jgi:hypothetical protein
MHMNSGIVITVATRLFFTGIVSNALEVSLKHYRSSTCISGSHMLMPLDSACEMAMLAAEIRPTRPPEQHGNLLLPPNRYYSHEVSSELR